MTCCIIQGPLYAVRSSSKHHYTFEKCYETGRQQWMHFLVAEHLISCADRGRPKSDILHGIWELFFAENGMVLAIRSLCVLSIAPLIVLIYLEEINMKH